jgi:galactofuranosylgalactofuranosylrhamnosyl-N-acetylglucosaminyl-diphospho-decaprenol beta-1,5/1,6-galactofuranosyltransferase
MPDRESVSAWTTTTTFAGNRVVDHAPPTRLVTQRGLFTGPSPLVPEELYLQVTSGRAHRRRGGVRLEPHTRASTNTYFGRFPASYWQRWTTVSEVEVAISAQGQGRMTVLASDSDGDARTLRAVAIDEPGKIRLTLPIDRFIDGGAMWVEWEAGDAGLTIDEMAWTVEPPERMRPVTVVICTYNRAEECVDTLSALAGDPAFLQSADVIYVVDQGTDLVRDRPRFPKVAAALGERLIYLTQPNLGGSGGFTRGLFEVTGLQGADHANVIFMDDDILCEPDTIVRLNAFANRTAEPAIVGAQMLNLLHPQQVHVSAETANLSTLAAGVPAKEALTSADVTEELLDVRLDAGYNGWWSCLIPAEVVAEIGLPLPFFFQWDDIEYGFRARGAGIATVTLEGAGVWHADFSWKDWDDWHRYFNIRNALITAALHSGFEPAHVTRALMSQLVRYLVAMQYGLAHTLIKAIDDFSQGPAVLADGGTSAAKAIRAERAAYGETVRHPATDMPGLRSGDPVIAPLPPPPSMTRAILIKRLLTQALGRTDRRPVSIRANEAHWYHVARFETAVVTDAGRDAVRVRQRDPEKARALMIRGVRSIMALRRRTAELQRAYREALPTLTSRENWARLYGLD